jgi:very-short-patch-repair endonuclease
MPYAEKRKYRSSIDRKSADFVLCDKSRVVPQLIIELDGNIHDFSEKKQRRDEFVDNLAGVVNLPILHIKTTNMDKEYIRNEVDKKLKL